MNIIIAEDQPLLRDTLKLYLEKESDFNVIGTVSNGEQIVESSRIKSPDLIIMDIKMPIMDGLKATEIIKKENPNIKILILTLYENEEELIESIISGADGYLLKDIEPETLINSIRVISQGVNVYKSDILRGIHKRLNPNCSRNNNIETPDFTEVEMNVIKKVCEGKQNKVIAQEMNCSLGTIKNKIGNILVKTGLADRTQLVIFALKQKIFN